MAVDDDLSEYERARLENIRRNSAFLSGIGIHEQKFLISAASSSSNSAPKRKRDEKYQPAAIKRETPTRYSLRVRQEKPNYTELKENQIPKQLQKKKGVIDGEEDDKDSDTIDYQYIPREPHLLDDFEFEIYVQLKKWRLVKSREEGIEAYKIFHNDTFCDMIRRKRNNPLLGREKDEQGNNREDKERSLELQECYGVGPSKSCINPKGLALECLEVIELPENMHRLDESRKLE